MGESSEVLNSWRDPLYEIERELGETNETVGPAQKLENLN
jgi:hypothetical protein